MQRLKCTGEVRANFNGKSVLVRYVYNPTDSALGLHDLFTSQEQKQADAENRDVISLMLNPGETIDLYTHYDAPTIETSLRRGTRGHGGLASYLFCDPPMLQVITESEFRKITVDSLSKGNTTSLADALANYDGSVEGTTIELDSPNIYFENVEAANLKIDMENARDKEEEREIIERYKLKLAKFPELRKTAQRKIDAEMERRGKKLPRLGPGAASDGILVDSKAHKSEDEVVYIPEKTTKTTPRKTTK